jgi:hypothetical protein
MDLRLCQAITERQLVMLTYAGVVRVVEPHLHGRTTAGHEALSAWMRPGWSRVDPSGGWRMFRLDIADALQLLPERFAGARPDFNPDDPHFVEVFCALTPGDVPPGTPGTTP